MSYGALDSPCPTFFEDWKLAPPEDQVPGLYTGDVDLGAVRAVPIDRAFRDLIVSRETVERFLGGHRFVGAAVAARFMAPENFSAFCDACPQRFMYFLEAYRDGRRMLMFGALVAVDGRVYKSGVCAERDGKRRFGPGTAFAVLRD